MYSSPLCALRVTSGSSLLMSFDFKIGCHEFCFIVTTDSKYELKNEMFSIRDCESLNKDTSRDNCVLFIYSDWINLFTMVHVSNVIHPRPERLNLFSLCNYNTDTFKWSDSEYSVVKVKSSLHIAMSINKCWTCKTEAWVICTNNNNHQTFKTLDENSNWTQPDKQPCLKHWLELILLRLTDSYGGFMISSSTGQCFWRINQSIKAQEVSKGFIVSVCLYYIRQTYQTFWLVIARKAQV